MIDYKFVEIKEEDLFPAVDDDCIYTHLSLKDYGWSTYEYKMRFRLSDGKILTAKETYTLFGTSDYILKVSSGYSVKSVSFSASSSLIMKHIKEQLEDHVLSIMDSESSPLNCDLAIKQYNELIRFMIGKPVTTNYYELEREEE